MLLRYSWERTRVDVVSENGYLSGWHVDKHSMQSLEYCEELFIFPLPSDCSGTNVGQSILESSSTIGQWKLPCYHLWTSLMRDKGFRFDMDVRLMRASGERKYWASNSVSVVSCNGFSFRLTSLLNLLNILTFDRSTTQLFLGLKLYLVVYIPSTN